MANCSIDGCERTMVARSWCRAHWKRWRKHGDPAAPTPPRRRIDPEVRFRAKLKVGKADECWEWQAARDELGYGFFRVTPGENMEKAHRVAWRLFNGPIPDGMCVCHRCDNPPCCNPFHLFLGTHQENMTDRSLKGRASRGVAPHFGETSPGAKLTQVQVDAIRAKRGSGVSQRAVGEQFGISQTQVGRIWRGVRWTRS